MMTRGALEAAWREATEPHDRAHVTPFLCARPERFAVRNACRDGGYDVSRRYRLARTRNVGRPDVAAPRDPDGQGPGRHPVVPADGDCEVVEVRFAQVARIEWKRDCQRFIARIGDEHFNPRVR